MRRRQRCASCTPFRVTSVPSSGCPYLSGYRLCGTLPARTAARRAVAVKRQLFDAFELDVQFAKLERRVRITATVTAAVARAFENEKAPEDGGFQVCTSDIAGAGFEPATFGL